MSRIVEKDSELAETFHQDWHFTKKNVYDICGFELTELNQQQGKEYGACTFKLNGKVIVFRVAKITPKKSGQFVAIWKRNEQGITQPFGGIDDLDFMVISTRQDGNIGQFLFPKAVLLEYGIITNGQEQGKRGIRVYPPWDKVGNRQAEKTQGWQLKYFVHLGENNVEDLDLLKAMFV